MSQGAPVTITRSTVVVDESTGLTTRTVTTFTGRMVGLGTDTAFRTFGHIEDEQVALLFIPSVYGTDRAQRIKQGDTVPWDGVTLTAQRVKHVNPDGRGVVLSKAVWGTP